MSYETAPWHDHLILARIPRCPKCGDPLDQRAWHVIANWAVCLGCYPLYVNTRYARLDRRTTEVIAMMCRVPPHELVLQSAHSHGVFFWTPETTRRPSLLEQYPHIAAENDPLVNPHLPDKPDLTTPTETHHY